MAMQRGKKRKESNEQRKARIIKRAERLAERRKYGEAAHLLKGYLSSAGEDWRMCGRFEDYSRKTDTQAREKACRLYRRVNPHFDPLRLVALF
jgi:hypothetical protein